MDSLWVNGTKYVHDELGWHTPSIKMIVRSIDVKQGERLPVFFESSVPGRPEMQNCVGMIERINGENILTFFPAKHLDFVPIDKYHDIEKEIPDDRLIVFEELSRRGVCCFDVALSSSGKYVLLSLT